MSDPLCGSLIGQVPVMPVMFFCLVYVLERRSSLKTQLKFHHYVAGSFIGNAGGIMGRAGTGKEGERSYGERKLSVLAKRGRSAEGASAASRATPRSIRVLDSIAQG